jgi:hypothetical protein
MPGPREVTDARVPALPDAPPEPAFAALHPSIAQSTFDTNGPVMASPLSCSAPGQPAPPCAQRPEYPCADEPRPVTNRARQCATSSAPSALPASQGRELGAQSLVLGQRRLFGRPLGLFGHPLSFFRRQRPL